MRVSDRAQRVRLVMRPEGLEVVIPHGFDRRRIPGILESKRRWIKRASGLVEGQADGSLVMGAIPQGDTVSVGDTVFTSGLGGNFPRQILIGQVTAVERKDYALYQEATVEPTVDFQHLESVLIITDFQPIEDNGP